MACSWSVRSHRPNGVTRPLGGTTWHSGLGTPPAVDGKILVVCIEATFTNGPYTRVGSVETLKALPPGSRRRGHAGVGVFPCVIGIE
jgi:hypothetical protein